MSIANKLQALLDLFTGAEIPLSNRNAIVDGNLDQWVASSLTLSTSGVGFGGPTMYHALCGTGGAGTLTQETFSPGAQPSGMNPCAQYYLQWAQTTASSGSVGASSAPVLFQNIENVSTLEGESSTFSVWLWVTSGTLTISNVCARQNFGTGGSPSTQVNVDTAVNWTVTTTPQRFTVRVDWPSSSGKTLGTTAGTSFIQIGLWLPTGSTFTINAGQLQLEQSSPQAPNNTTGTGGAPTAFEYRGYGPELARVLRYYYSTGTISFTIDFPNSPGSGYNVYGFISLPVQMRAQPTATATWTAGNAMTVPGTIGIVTPQIIQPLLITSGSGNCYAYLTSLILDARL
jgi:hypothetical protein